MKLFTPLMKNWLKTQKFCQKLLKSVAASIAEAFNASCVNSMNVVKGRAFDPKSKGNETGYLISAINWNDKRGYVGGLSLFYDYFNLKKDDYFMGRTGARLAYKKMESEKNYEKYVKTKV